MGVWIIVRDQEMNVLASMCFFKQFIVDRVVAEAYAAWNAVEFSRDLGMLKIILKGDALEIVNALRMHGRTILEPLCQLIDDAKTLLRGFCSWEVRHAKREANKATHSWAKTYILQSLEQIWMKYYPILFMILYVLKIVSFLRFDSKLEIFTKK